VLAVQNAVDYRDLGVATSGATLFRSIGGSVGTAVLGSIFSNRLKAELASGANVSGSGSARSLSSVSHLSSATVKKLPPTLHTDYLRAFTDALTTVFAVAAAVAAGRRLGSAPGRTQARQRPTRGRHLAIARRPTSRHPRSAASKPRRSCSGCCAPLNCPPRRPTLACSASKSISSGPTTG
jgi:hypothetical protein